ncbi:hypothetical protein GGR51DRAFT_557318 [Nemania sp. FL0031]|nr:hypothetical protein GGR51DRAFT_557318 [Nemania sp. FL0031]
MLRRFTIQPSFNRKAVIFNLTVIAPDKQPWKSALYILVRKTLLAVDNVRTQTGYNPTSAFIDIPAKGQVEAFRIFGSATWGVGTIPNPIEFLLTKTGLIWLAFPENVLKVPEYWLRYSKKHKVISQGELN